MPNPDLERLRGIKTFPSLVKYLRDDLDWPIESENFDDLTFDFEPEELGIDLKTSAKIESIKQLRPLSSNQPWGIFFVKFEPKKLPVVALRRILGKLVIKKRASANRPDQQTWRINDLLFLSNYGENEQRQITFAHFSGKDDSKNLPTLKVLGWDGADTPLHIDHIHSTLKDKLLWPKDDESSLGVWRKTWSSAFTLRHGEVIKTSEELAVRLAELAQKIRERVNSILLIETEIGPLQKLMKGFKEALIHDLTEDTFADMYAQTIAYGLLTARITNPKGDNPDELASQVQITNPFLKELMETFLSVGGRKGKAGDGAGIDFDELGINEIVDLLDNSNMEAVLRDFGDKNPLEDPVIHFYELFLKKYDSKQKVNRGVFYTPRPVVSFIVRSVDNILRTKFKLKDGLADTTTWKEMTEKNESIDIPKGAKPDSPFVQILDPATGTGTFLVEVIGLIHTIMTRKWKDEGKSDKEIVPLWNNYVPNHLLPRLHGYELLMAPYAIAHLKIGTKLYETGYDFEKDERTQIYLTNSLEPPSDSQKRLAGILPALANEAEAVNEIKRKKPFTVIIGNPPYSNFGQLNKNPFILSLLEDYKRNLQEKKINLDDDFIKFLRFVHHLLDEASAGVLGFITNNTYLDGITHRQMRRAILDSNIIVQVIDLHGSSIKKERAPDGSKDENVFDIRQGVAATIFVKREKPRPSKGKVYYADLFGARDEKYKFLSSNDVSTVKWIELKDIEEQSCLGQFFFFRPTSSVGIDEYCNGVSLADIFVKASSGIQTKRDKLFVDREADHLADRMREVLREGPNKKMKAKYPLHSTGGWDAEKLNDVRYENLFIRRYAFRPYDWRYLYYDPKLLGRARLEVSKYNKDGNFSLVYMRQTVDDGFRHALVTDSLVDINLLMNHHVSDRVAPLYIEEGVGLLSTRVANFSNTFVAQFSDLLNLEFQHSKSIDEKLYWGPEDFLGYAYAYLWSPHFRDLYAEFLKTSYPRIPLPRSPEVFWSLSKLGWQLIYLHLLQSSPQSSPTFPISGANMVESIKFHETSAGIGRLQLNALQYFDAVPIRVWEHKIGCYSVVEKWLKGRQGSLLTSTELQHIAKVMGSINDTFQVLETIDSIVAKPARMR